jgi:hypothetical protein
VTSPARPPSFHEEHVWDWCGWVLRHGLPDLPLELREGEAAPVAYAKLGEWAAVVTVAHDPTEDPPALDSNVQTYRRSATGWEEANGTGGTGWSPGTDLRRPPWLGPRKVATFGRGWYGHPAGWASADLVGVAGAGAATVEVEQAGVRHRQPIDSPIGAWVAVFDGREPAVVRVLGGPGAVLLEQ